MRWKEVITLKKWDEIRKINHRDSECEDSFEITKYCEGKESYTTIENSGVNVGKGLSGQKRIFWACGVKPKPVRWEAASHANTLEKSLQNPDAGLFQELKVCQCSWCVVNGKRGRCEGRQTQRPRHGQPLDLILLVMRYAVG